MTLTIRQQQTLDYIRDYRAEIGCPPTQREIAKWMGLHLKTVQQHLRALKQKGAIEHTPYSARRITVK